VSTCLSFNRVVAVAASTRGRAAVAGVTVALPALAVYLLTLMPDVGFWDTAEFQAIGPVLGIAHPTGFPAYTLLAWLASVVLQPFGNEALRANMLSALLGAGGVGLVSATTTLLTSRLTAGIAAGAALAVTGEAWAISLRADPHALHLFLAALLLLLLVVWSQRVAAGRPADGWLIAAAACFGVSLANHALTLLLAPGIGLFVLVVQPGIVTRPRLVLSAAVVLALTTVALYLYLPIRSAMNPPLDYANPETWEGFRYLVLAEQFRGSFQALPDAGAALRQVIRETFNELGLIAVLALPGVFVAARRRPQLALMLFAWFVIGWAFALGYVNAAIGRYYLVPLMAMTVLGGIGAGALLDGLESVLRARPPARLAAAVLAALVLIGAALAAVPIRHGENDASSDIAARQWLTGIMDRLPPDALVVSWWSYSTTLWYGKYVEGMRPDVTVVDDSTIVQKDLGDAAAVIDSHLGQRPVFLIRLAHDMPQFEERYELTKVPGIPGGPVYRVEGPRSLPTGDAIL